MIIQQNGSQVWRFGVFELDALNLELRRNGVPVRIREQSFRVLVYMVEHAGQMVSREELRGVLWAADTFVDFEHGLNTAMMKLRFALGDVADAPVYIETVPKRGYRFVAPVSKLYEAEAPAGLPQPPAADDAPAIPAIPIAARASPFRHPVILVVGAAPPSWGPQIATTPHSSAPFPSLPPRATP